MEESAENAKITVVRKGDLTPTTTVRVITKSGSAVTSEDFEEREDTDESIVSFQPGTTSHNAIGKTHEHRNERIIFHIRRNRGGNHDSYSSGWIN